MSPNRVPKKIFLSFHCQPPVLEFCLKPADASRPIGSDSKCPQRLPFFRFRFSASLWGMKHILINLLLFPFRVALDAVLILATAVIVIFCFWTVIHLFGLLIFLALLIGEPVALLLPFIPLVFLKHPWPQPSSSDSDDESGGKLVHAVLL